MELNWTPEVFFCGFISPHTHNKWRKTAKKCDLHQCVVTAKIQPWRCGMICKILTWRQLCYSEASEVWVCVTCLPAAVTCGEVCDWTLIWWRATFWCKKERKKKKACVSWLTRLTDQIAFIIWMMTPNEPKRWAFQELVSLAHCTAGSRLLWMNATFSSFVLLCMWQGPCDLCVFIAHHLDTIIAS